MIETATGFLGWCTLINWAILFVWWGTLVLAHDGLQALHGRWFQIEPERFDEVHYRLMGQFKLGILLLNFTPYIALSLAG